MIELLTPLVSVNGRYSIQRGRNLLSKKYRQAKEALQWEIRSQWKGEPLEGDVAVTIIHYWKGKRKRDIDNYLKLLGDSMTDIVYLDDSQIVEMHVYKKAGNTNKVLVTVEKSKQP